MGSPITVTDTLEGNARLKAAAIALASGLPAIAGATVCRAFAVTVGQAANASSTVMFAIAMAYAYWPRNKRRFDEAANIPLHDEED